VLRLHVPRRLHVRERHVLLKRMQVFASIFCYPIAKFVADPEAFIQQEIAAGEQAEWPCFRTLARLRKLVGPLQLLTDRATLIAKARSRAAHTFLRRSEADVWVTIDDDIEASEEDLKLLLSALRDDDTAIVIGPCAMRDDMRLNIVAEQRKIRTTADGTRLLEVTSGGAALVGYKRAAIETMAGRFPELWYVNAPDDIGIALFLEVVDDHHWIGEDMKFCGRARASGVRIESLVDTAIVHAGVPAKIDDEWLKSPEATTSDSIRPPALETI